MLSIEIRWYVYGPYVYGTLSVFKNNKNVSHAIMQTYYTHTIIDSTMFIITLT